MVRPDMYLIIVGPVPFQRLRRSRRSIGVYGIQKHRPANRVDGHSTVHACVKRDKTQIKRQRKRVVLDWFWSGIGAYQNDQNDNQHTPEVQGGFQYLNQIKSYQIIS